MRSKEEIHHLEVRTESIIRKQNHNTWGLYETCGIHNLHAMPAVVGALSSVVVAAYNYDQNTEIYGANAVSQWWRQLLGILLCIAFSVISGLCVGRLLLAIDPPHPMS